MFTRLKSLMKGSLQVVFSKSDGEEFRCVARWEVRKKTGLELLQMQYLVIDKDYDCDIYIYDIERFKSRYTELLKVGL